MRRTRALFGAVLACGLLFAPAAHAALSISVTSEAVVVTGDDGTNRIQVQDGSTSGGDDYAFAFYSEDGESVDLGSSGACVSDGGSPVENIYCGNSGFNNAVFNLNGGNDSLGSFNDPQMDVLGSLSVDFGGGNDENEGGAFYQIPTGFRGGEGDDNLAGQEGPTSVVEGGGGADRIAGGGALGGETLRGGPGNDEIQGLNGSDQIFGDEGNDILVGGADGDTVTGGSGQDNVQGDGVPNAFSGNDTLHLSDGERDSGSCGFGADTANVDGLDLLPAGDCETVNGGGGSGGGGGGGGSGGGASVALGTPARVSARTRRVSLRVRCPGSASGRCAGRASFVVTFRERGRRRRASLGSASFNLRPGASRRVSRRMSRRLFNRLRRARNRKLAVRATSRDAAGQVFRSSRTFTLRLG